METISRISTQLSPQSEGDYIGIYPSSPQIHIHNQDNYTHINGFVSTSSDPAAVDAVLVPDMEECIISRIFAVELALEIRRLDDMEGHAVIMFSDEEHERVQEQVRIEWTEMGEQSRPFRVRCLVSRSVLPGSLMFGRPFVKKRMHYLVGEGSGRA